MDNEVVNSGIFHVAMTNGSSRHIKINYGQILGMLKSCNEDNICTIHKIATFQQTSEDTKPQLVEKEMYCIPIRNLKTGKIEINTLLKKNEFLYSTETKGKDLPEGFVIYKKTRLRDAPVNSKILQDLEQLLTENKEAFADDEREIGVAPLIKMSIDTGDHPPIAKRPYTLSVKHYDWVKDELDKLLEAGIIRESHSSWSAPIVVVPKAEGGKCLCVDFRAHNAITRKYIWPMPRVEDIFSKLGKAKYFTTLDLRVGYHHIALDDDAIKKTAFVSPFGKFEFLHVCFGLAQAPAFFQNLMNKVLNGLHFTMAYLDDIIIFNETAEQHLTHIKIVLHKQTLE